MIFENVNRVGFGAMQLPGPHVVGPPKDHDVALAVLRRAVELGVNHIDTAPFYGPRVSDELIREALHPYGDELHLVSKAGARRDEKGAWLPAQRPEEVREQVETDLELLGTESLFAVNLRVMQPGERPDVDGQDVPLDEFLGGLLALRKEGKIQHVGASNVTVAQLEQIAAQTELACVQQQYGVLDRGHQDVLDWCIANDVAFVPYFPLGSAFGVAPRPWDDERIVAAAERLDATPSQVALAWLLELDPRILLIPGTSSVEHLEENMAVADVALDDEARAALA